MARKNLTHKLIGTKSERALEKGLVDAQDVAVDSSSFNNNLESADDTVQKVANKIDNLTVSSGGGGTGPPGEKGDSGPPGEKGDPGPPGADGNDLNYEAQADITQEIQMVVSEKMRQLYSGLFLMNGSGTALYRVNPENGGVTLVNSNTGISNARGFAFLQGQVFVVRITSNRIDLLTIDLNTGSTASVNSIVPTNIQASAIVNHNGSLYVATNDFSKQFYRIDITTNSDGSLSAASVLLGNAPSNANIYGMTSKDGVLYANTGTRLQTLDIDTLTLTSIGTYNLENGMRGISFVGDTLYGVGSVSDSLFSIDITTGLATGIGNAFTGAFSNLTNTLRAYRI